MGHLKVLVLKYRVCYGRVPLWEGPLQGGLGQTGLWHAFIVGLLFIALLQKSHARATELWLPDIVNKNTRCPDKCKLSINREFHNRFKKLFFSLKSGNHVYKPQRLMELPGK